MFATMDRETFICNHLKDKMGISIFAGAGVSCGSKLPLASPLLDFIVQSVMPEEISDKEDFKLSINLKARSFKVIISYPFVLALVSLEC